MRSYFVGIALIAALGIGCDRDDPNADRRASAPGEGGGLSGGANPQPASPAMPNTSASGETQITPADEDFMKEVAKANQLEIDAAKLGQDKAQSPDVKEFAAQLEQDHSEALNELRRVAIDTSVVLETERAEKASAQNKFGNQTGRAFDRAWLQSMIEDHQKDIADFERQANNATGELKEFIDKTLPVMREHLQKAEQLEKTLDNSSAR